MHPFLDHDLRISLHKALPFDLVDASDLGKSVGYVLKHLVELFYFHRNNCSGRADTLGRVGVWGDSSYVLKTQEVAWTHHHDFLTDGLLSSLFDHSS